jgi:hypothetical protein
MKSIYKKNFFNIKEFEEIKNFVFSYTDSPDSLNYSDSFKRYYKIVSLPNEVKDMLLSKARKEIKDDSLEIFYSQIVKYQIKDGIVPELIRHKDGKSKDGILGSAGEWVMDIVVDGTINWPLIIENNVLDNFPNCVMFVKGEEDVHERPVFNSTNDLDYIILLFVHLANKDSEYIRISKQIFSMPEKAIESFLRLVVPEWKTKNSKKEEKYE